MEFKKKENFTLNKILLLNPFGIGDVLFSTPVISALKRKNPNSFIAYICNKRVKELLEKNKKVDKVFVYEKDDWRRLWHNNKIACIKEGIDFIMQLKNYKFDLAIDISLSRHWGGLFKIIGIKERIGFNYKKRGIFLTKKIDIDGFSGKHIVEYNLDLLKLIYPDIYTNFGLEFPLVSEDEKWAEEFLHCRNITADERLVGIVPGGGSSWGKDAYHKHWPVEYFAKVADKLNADFAAKIILFGDSKEMDLCGRFLQIVHAPIASACGATTLGQFAALIKRCKVVVCNDGGPLHVAASLGVRTVSIFGPVNPNVYGPYPKDGHKIFFKGLGCQPCYKKFRLNACRHMDCLTKILPEEVIEAASQNLI